ncbi:hypothetical protein Cni_G19727 [Canna indica]|uniref:Uncharacterized protein n=1 Tax=Canna indica TaxID=4628 RepID=A0AAQ3KS69_9LILI|nr:hypothetical protein Cni_G19727 [Canna indica]
MEGGGRERDAPSIMQKDTQPLVADPGAGDLSKQEETLLLLTENAGSDESDAATDDFEFTFVVMDRPDTWPYITADEIFSNGFIRALLPADSKIATGRKTLRRFFIEERADDSGSTSSSSLEVEDKLESIPAANYCLWTPTRCKKSRSTGSSLRRRFRDLVSRRSHSDEKNKFVFFEADQEKSKNKNIKKTVLTTKNAAPAAAAGKEEFKKEKESVKGREKKIGKAMEVDAVTVPRIHYSKDGGASGRRSFLTYKQDLCSV